LNKQDNPGKALQAVEFLSGYGTAKIKNKKDYRIVPFYLAFDLNLKNLLVKKGINYWGLQQFIIEPFVSYAFSERKNAEAGSNFGIKLGLLPDDWVIQPYLKAGVGAIYLTQHFKNQSTQFNFTEYAGAGLHFFPVKNIALTLEYRYRHISNADIKFPNNGIDTNIGLCGLSYFF
jgi:opacity protein-like surface antigen